MKLLILFVVLFSASAMADDFGVSTVLEAVGTSMASDLTGGGQSRANILVGEADKRASLTWAKKSPDSVFSFEVSVPSNDDDPTKLGTLDGLAAGNKVTFNYNRVRFPKPASNDLASLLSECRRLRHLLGEADKQEETGCSPDQVIADAQKLAHRGDLSKAELKSLARSVWGSELVWLYGVSASYGEDTYKYIDFLTNMEQEVEENGWAASLYAGVVVGAEAVWSLEYKREKSFGDQDQGILCDATITPIACVSGPLGKPKEEKSNIVSLQYRGKLFGQMVAPKLSYNDEEDSVGFSLPVFAFQNSENSLSGGYTLDWNSEDDEWSFGVFVGSEFSFYD